MLDSKRCSFDVASLHSALEKLSDEQLDHLEFGVIGFNFHETVTRYNATESRLAGLTRERVVGQGLFSVVAPCMNNFLVAQRFQDAATAATSLDVVIDYVLTLKMRPTKVRLRLLTSPELANRYVLVQR